MKKKYYNNVLEIASIISIEYNLFHLLDEQHLITKAKSWDDTGKSWINRPKDPARNFIIQGAKKKARWGLIEKRGSIRADYDPTIEDKQDWEGYGKN